MDFTSISSDPELFIALLEYSLESKEKFARVVPLLPAEITKPVRDIILNTPSMWTPTPKIAHLLSEERLGDKKPSELLRRLKELAGINKENSIIRHIFLRRLPEKWQQILAAVSDSVWRN